MGRRRRLLTRSSPLIALALVSFIVGVVVGSGAGEAEHQLVTSYVRDFSSGNYAAMYQLLDPSSQRRLSEVRFAGELEGAAVTATAQSLKPLNVGDPSGSYVPVQVRVRTRVFGTLREVLEVPVDTSGESPRVRYGSSLLFPGLRPGEQLTRVMRMPARATILASDGTPLAQGPTRSSPIPDVAQQIVGTVGPIPAGQATTYAADGYPAGTKVGVDGLERVFQTQVAGTPGGRLLAGSRVLARATARPGTTATSTIDPRLERAAVSAMGGSYAGIVAMDPNTGKLLALAGVAFSALQPPGSTMKIVTSSGALEAGIVKLSDTFPIQTSADVGGFNLQNANGEACGGTFLNAFAVSCNSVFAPLGAKLGGARLVNIAERFGFNEPPSIPGASEPTIPTAGKIGGDTDVGSSAIGQGQVQSTALGMTDIAATIAMGGRRPIPTLQENAVPRYVPVISHHIAGEVQRMMVAVVEFGTGTSAQIPGVKVAGKTGTAELTDTVTSGGGSQDTDAWFVGYAPVGAPKIVVGALFPNNGAGGQTAAPAVRGVLVAALHSH